MSSSKQRLAGAGAMAAPWLTALTLTLASGLVHAQDKRADEQVRRLRQQVQELQQAQSGQEAALAKANQERTALSKQVGEAGQARSAAAEASRRALAASGEAQRLRKEKEALQSELSALKAELDKARSELSVSQTTQKVMASTLSATQSSLKGNEQKLQSCVSHNGELIALGRELLSNYVSVATSSSEPFVQVKRVALENQAQLYEDKLSQQKVKP